MTFASAIGRSIRNVRRAQEVVRVLVRYGFDDVVHELGLDLLIDRTKRIVGLKRADATELKREPQAVRLRKVMEELGPTFVKLGQILSTRPDLIPPDWAEEFARLQDDARPVPYGEIREALEAEYGDRIGTLFESIEEEPIAAASIAQVHRARLAGGDSIVLKIIRPGIRDVIESDMEILSAIANFAEEHFKNLGYSPVDVVDQFERELRRETDFTYEGRSTDRLRRAFEDDENVRFPRVYWEATTESVLALEEIRGVLLSRRKPGDFTEEELRSIVANGTDAIFRQCLEIGFFHADPHPGNIFAFEGGAICFIDCGMTGHIDPRTAEYLADLVQGTVSGDLDRVIDVIVGLSGADHSVVDDRVFRADVWEFVSRFDNATFDALQMGALLQEFFEKVRRHKLRVPADIVFLIKSITTIEGVGERLCPDFDVVSHVRPYVERLVKRRYGLRALRQRFQSSMIGYAQLTEELPRNLRMMMTSMRRNAITVNLEHRGLDRLTNTIEHASRNIARALIVAALLVGSSIVMLAERASGVPFGPLSIAAIVGFALAGLLALGMITIGRKR